MLDEKSALKFLKKKLSEKRFLHSCAVADEAQRIAQLYGEDPIKSRLTGLLHDICKDENYTNQLQMIEKFGIILDSVEKNIPKLWHSLTGAAFLQHELGIQDKDMLNAVRYHSTARAGMSPLEKIVYIADFTSADRKYPSSDIIREALKFSLNKAIEVALSLSISELIKRGKLIHLNSIMAYNEIILENQEASI